MINQILEILFEEDNPRIVAIYGGGFKPPTKGHFAVVEKTLADFPEIDELIVYVGGGVRDGITQEESIKIWEIYKNYLSSKVKILPSIAPVKSVLDYAKENPTDKIYWVLGAREGDEEDIKDIENRTRSVEKYPNLEVKVITTKGGVSGTKTRQAIKSGNKEQFFHLVPDVEEKEEIWNLVTPVVKEIKNKRAEIIKAKKAKMEAKKSLEEGFIENTQENMKKLLLAIKQEGKETRDAFKLVLQAAKGEIQLTDEQKKQIGDQLKDVLKSIGLISIAILPGSFIVGALIKIFKAERLVFPSSLLPEVGEANLKPYKWEEVDVEGYFVYTSFITDSETEYNVDLESKMYIDDDFNNLRALGVEFAAKPKGAEGSSTKIVVNKGELYRVMATIVDIVKKYVKKSKAQVILYSPAKKSSEEDFGSQRDNLYKTFISKAFPGVKFEQEGEIVAAILPNNKVKDLQENIISETMTVYRLGEIPYDEKSFFVTPDYKTWIKFYPGEEIHKITTNKLYLPLRSKSFSSWDELRSKYDSGEFTDDDVSYINPEESGIQDFEQYEIKPDDIIDLEQINLEEGRKKKPDPKKGTGKKPEGSGRRLYTDEDPKDTVGIKFKTKEDIVDTLNKTSFKAKSHARQSQVINLIHQRVRAAYGKAKDPEVKSRLKRALDYIESRKESSKEKTKRLNKLKEFEGDSNPLNLPHIDTWHDAQYKAQDGKTEEAIKLMTKAADEAEKYAKENQDGGVAGEAGYYRGTIAWLKKDYTTVEKYINDKFVKFTGNDEVLKRLLKNKDKSYKEAYNLKEASDPQAGTALPYGSGFAPVKESDPFGLNEFAKQFVKEVFEEGWNFKEGMVSLTKYMIDNGMNIKPLPKIKVIDNDKDNASKLLGKTAHYDPVEKSITLFTMNRHPKDVLRSFAHEMIHHEQNLENKLGNINTTNTNEDGDLPEIEREAYEKGNMMLRNWEDSIKAEKYLKEYKQKALTELFEKDLPNIEKINDLEYLVGNGDDIEAKYYFRLDEPELNKWSIHWNFTNNNQNTSPEAWKQVTTTSFKVLKDFINNKKPNYISISGNESKKGKNAKLNIYKSKSFLEKLENIFNNQYLIKNDDESMVLMKSIEEAYKYAINESVKYGGEKYEDALYYWQNLDINSRSKIERWSAIKRKVQREVLCELYNIKNV